MFRILRALIVLLLLACPVNAAVNNIAEEDGSPSKFPWKVKVPNGSLTDNGDGTASLAFGSANPWTADQDMGGFNLTNGTTINATHIIGNNTAYGAGWNGSLDAPSQNVVYDKIESMVAGTLPALTSAHIWVGNGTAVATDVAMSGDVALNNTGGTSIVAANASNISSGTLSVSRMNRANATLDGYYNSTEWNNNNAKSFGFCFGDGTNAINSTTPVKAISVPFNCTVTKAEIKENGGTAGNLTVDIQKTLNVSDYNWTTICGGAKPNLTAANYSSQTNMTGYNQSIKSQEWFKPVLSGNDTVKTVTVVIYVTKT